MGLFSYLFASDNKRSLMKIEKIVNQHHIKKAYYDYDELGYEILGIVDK